MDLLSTLKDILNLQKKIDLKKLPSQGLFYKEDFEISIKKANIEDIIEYEYEYKKDNLGLIISRLKKVVKNNSIISNNYSFLDIKSTDIVFIFLEIVKFTNNKPINIINFDELTGQNEIIPFDSNTFNYVKLGKKFMDKYDNKTKEIVIDGYRYSMPSIGSEDSLARFLISKSQTPDCESYNKFSYDFLYFMGNKNKLNPDEIENLIHIFNFDISDEDRSIIRNIVKSLFKIGKYSLKKDSNIIDISSKIDLEKIWR